MPEEAASPAPQQLERKLATILSADVAGYSRLMSEDEEQTLRIFRGHKEVFESLVGMHKGRIFNTAGDAILAEFGSAVEAVRCATEIQAALQTRNNQFPPQRQVRFRIGVNLGDVMVQGQDLLGDGVNLAARLQTAAEPGGICVSGSVYDQIRNKLSLSFNPLGERSYKNIPQPVRTFSITECEDHSSLPSAKPTGRRPARWAAAAVVLVAAAAAGFWVYTKIERSAGPVHTEASAAAPSEATPRAPVHPESKAETSEVQNEAVKPKSPAVAAAHNREPAVRTAAATSSKAGATAASERSSPDGVYSGQTCFGPVRQGEGFCTNAQGILSKGKLSGRWSGRMPGVTMYLTGEVSPSGEVQIQIQNEKDGKPQGRAELTGSVHDGELSASGSFRTGRSARLAWHKQPSSLPGSSASR